MFLVEMNRREFDSLNDASLIWACVEPTIEKIRGKNASVKTDAYAQLSKGQRALLLFQVLYGHSKSGVAEFYSIVPYLPSGAEIWQELKRSMRLFEGESLLRLLDDMEQDYRALDQLAEREGLENAGAAIRSLAADLTLNDLIQSRDEPFRGAISDAIRSVSAYIRKNPLEFIRFREENGIPMRVVEGLYAVCRLGAGEPVPPWGTQGAFSSVTRTGKELSIVCEQRLVPQGAQAELDWRMFEVAGPLDFSLVGILAAITGSLRERKISCFAVSTYDTDYILVKDKDFAAAVSAWQEDGISVK